LLKFHFKYIDSTDSLQHDHNYYHQTTLYILFRNRCNVFHSSSV